MTTTHTKETHSATTLTKETSGRGIMCNNTDLYCNNTDYYCDGTVVKTPETYSATTHTKESY